MKGTVTSAALLFAMMFPPPVFAQDPGGQSQAVSKTFTISAIDSTSRIVTLDDDKGLSQDVLCGPEVQRFDQLKVGDKVTMSYKESIVTAVNKTGTSTPVSTAGVTRTPGNQPGGTITRQMTTSVTIEAIDPSIPSVTVKTADGHRMSFKVSDKKNLDGYKAGDTVDITYTQALAISVTPAK
jgi:hypothetical protein